MSTEHAYYTYFLSSAHHSNVINRKFNHSMTKLFCNHPKNAHTHTGISPQNSYTGLFRKMREKNKNILNWTLNVCIKIGMPHGVHTMPCNAALACASHPMYFIIGIKWITNILWNVECVFTFRSWICEPIFHFIHYCHVRIALETLLIVLIIVHVCIYFRSNFNRFQ